MPLAKIRWLGVLDRVRRARLDRDIDDELRFHVDTEVEQAVREGLSEGEARRFAHERLGGTPLSIRERIHDARGVSFADDLGRDVCQGLRLLRRAPTVTAVVLCTLGIAMGGTVTAFSLADAWLFRPLSFPAADRLVVAFMATSARPTEPAVWMPYRAYVSWRDSVRSFSSVSAAFFRGATWRSAAGATSVVGMRVSPEFFETLGVRPFIGRHLAMEDAAGTPAIVLSYGFWQRELGGSPSQLGSVIALSDVAYTVVGVMPADFDVRILDRPEGAAFWTLIRPGDHGYEAGGMGPVAIIGRLAPGVERSAARAEAAAVMARAERPYAINFNQPDASGQRFVVHLSSLQEDNTRTVRATLLTLFVAAVCLLVVAATNVGVLLLGHGLTRRGEVAIRHALGAGRARLVRQFLTESLVLSTCSSVIALGLAWTMLRGFVAWNPLGTLPPAGVHLDLRAVIVAAVAAAVTTVVAGLVPALRLSASMMSSSLRIGDGSRATVCAQRAQRAMLAAQIAVSTVVLVCAALLGRTVLQLRSEPLGFGGDGVDVAEIALPNVPFESNAARNRFYDALEQALMSRPGVRLVGAATSPPLAGGAFVTIQTTAEDATVAPRMSAPSVTTTYFEVMSIPLMTGRVFTRADTPESRAVVVLNARAATQLFGGADAAVGRRVRLEDDRWRDVVGVVGDVKSTFFNTLEWQTAPIVYQPASQSLTALTDPEATLLTLWVSVLADRPLSVADVRDAAAGAGPRAAVLSLQRVADLVAVATRQPTFRMTLLLGFATISLLLAAIGAYGLVAQSVADRLRDTAIRIALGAHPRAVRADFVRRVLATGAVGLAFGVVLSLLLTRLLASMLYGVRTGDASSVLVAGVVLLAITGLAAWVSAWRATRVAATAVLRA